MNGKLRGILLVISLVWTVFANSQTFNLTWSDEFNTGTTVLPDATQWNNEVGAIRNGELQYYTDKDIDNQVVKDGNLLIIGKKETFGGQNYTSASLKTKSGWKYGRIESKFKMQTGMGIWACFWTMGLSGPMKGNDWPFCGEIDILEHINNEIPYHGTVHWWNESKPGNDKHDVNGGTIPNPVGSYNPNEYNVYGIEWTPSYIKWYLNDKTVKTVSILNGVNGMYEFHEPHYILLNCPIGGSWPSGEPGWDATKIPVVDTMFVDYVRVYGYNSGAPAAPQNLVTSSVTQNSVNLSWNASADATAYDVVIDNNGVVTTVGPVSSTSCNIPGLIAGTTYAIRVKARNVSTNSSDLSEMSNPAYVTTLAGSPAVPLINMQLNENAGTTTVNTGSIGGTFNLKNTTKWTTSIPSNAATGISAIEFATTKDAVESPAALNQLIGLNDITITGWLNCKDGTETNSGGNRIVSSMNSQWFDATKGTSGIDLVSKADGSLQLGINEATKTTSPRSSASKITIDPAAPASNWKFFAVTYSAASKSVSFYFGNSSTTATLDKTVTYDRGVLGPYTGPLAIGNFNSVTRGWLTNRYFRGLIDQIQIYNSSLNLSQIVAVQNNGITTVNNLKTNSERVNIYPNPAKNNVTVSLSQFDASDAVDVTLFNVNGILMYQNPSIENPSFNIPLNNYANGIYFIKVQTNKETLIQKFIVDK
jgi:beta-glucanase (GH16 family)